MTDPTYDYQTLVQTALRGMVRDILADVAKRQQRPGDHHFHITFLTNRVEGIPDWLQKKYPEEMSIVLQHQFWDLTVTDASFSVRLSFSGYPITLSIPLDALTAFADPSVRFGLAFAPDPKPAAQAEPIKKNGHGAGVVFLDDFREKPDNVN